MTIEEELIHLREEKSSLQKQLTQRDERIQDLEKVLWEQKTLIQQMQEQTSCLISRLD